MRAPCPDAAHVGATNLGRSCTTARKRCAEEMKRWTARARRRVRYRATTHPVPSRPSRTFAPGLDVDGCDVSADMTAIREKSEREGLSPTLFVQPMHELDPPRT
jgi:hypothetical protein